MRVRLRLEKPAKADAHEHRLVKLAQIVGLGGQTRRCCVLVGVKDTAVFRDGLLMGADAQLISACAEVLIADFDRPCVKEQAGVFRETDIDAETS